MKIETLLPLGKVDPGLRASEQPLNIDAIGTDASLVEALGYDRLVVEETKDDPFVLMTLAARTTTTLGLGTSVAIAFPRAPALTAMSAWTLQKLSRGRFCLGLGPQVKGHIQRRCGLEWQPPGPWMRDYIGAVRALWDCWQNGTRLAYESQHYNLNLMVPLFNPGPIMHPRIPIMVAAVGEKMCQTSGEIADGVRAHPVCTPKYIKQVMLPAVRTGAARSGRSLDDFEVALKPLIATAGNAETLAVRVRDARARIAFYASTAAYRPAFEAHGLGGLATELNLLSKQQKWEEMPTLISDEVLHEFVTIATYDEIGNKLIERYENVITSLEFSIEVTSEEDRIRLGDLVKQLHAAA